MTVQDIINKEIAKNKSPRLKHWDRIKVSYEDAQMLAVNGLPINKNVYVTDLAFKDTIGKELEKRDMTVEYIDFKTFIVNQYEVNDE